MDLRIERADDGTWTLYRAGVAVAASLSHESALAAITDELNAAALDAARLAISDDGALLPEEWESPVLCESGPTGPSRDFTECVWTSRDPGANLVPLMLSTTTEMGGHIGARLVGFFTELDTSTPTPTGRGRFFASDHGEEARDLLLGTARFGVSVDPSENVEYRIECVEMSDDGWCEQERIVFEAYEIGGATMTPFPGFARAYVQLTGATTPDAAPAPAEDDEEPPADGEEAPPADDDEETASIAASGSIPAGACCDACASARTGGHRHTPSLTAAGATTSTRPSTAMFGDPMLQGLTALRFLDSGEVIGHLAPWGQCHTGSPAGSCVLTPRSLSSYAHFRTGYVITAEGDEVPTGRLTLGGGHADLRLSHRGAVEHYDNAGSAIADLAVGEDAYGVWVHGMVRPGTTEEQLHAARASSPSGDWRQVGAGLELVAALCVNQPGFVTARVASGHVEALVAAGARVMGQLNDDPSDARIARLERELADVRATITAPARAQLSAMRRARLREQLTAMR